MVSCQHNQTNKVIKLLRRAESKQIWSKLTINSKPNNCVVLVPLIHFQIDHRQYTFSVFVRKHSGGLFSKASSNSISSTAGNICAVTEVCYLLLEQAKPCSISEQACQTQKLPQAVGTSFCLSYIKWSDNYIQQLMHKMNSWPQLMLQRENHYIHSMTWCQFSVDWYNLFVEHLSASACWSLRALEQLDKKNSISIYKNSQKGKQIAFHQKCKISAQCS